MKQLILSLFAGILGFTTLTCFANNNSNGTQSTNQCINPQCQSVVINKVTTEYHLQGGLGGMTGVVNLMGQHGRLPYLYNYRNQDRNNSYYFKMQNVIVGGTLYLDDDETNSRLLPSSCRNIIVPACGKQITINGVIKRNIQPSSPSIWKEKNYVVPGSLNCEVQRIKGCD